MFAADCNNVLLIFLQVLLATLAFRIRTGFAAEAKRACRLRRISSSLGCIEAQLMLLEDVENDGTLFFR